MNDLSRLDVEATQFSDKTLDTEVYRTIDRTREALRARMTGGSSSYRGCAGTYVFQ